MYEKEITIAILKELFLFVPEIEYLLLLLPPHIKSLYLPIQDFFVVIKDGMNFIEWNKCKIACCERSRKLQIHNVNVRIARVEDHDDLVPIFDKQSQFLSRVSDKFFLASLIEQQSQHQKTVVAEVC